MRMFFLIFFENLFFCKKLFNSSGDDFGICAPPIDEPTTMVHSAILSRVVCVCYRINRGRLAGGQKAIPRWLRQAGRQRPTGCLLVGDDLPPQPRCRLGQ